MGDYVALERDGELPVYIVRVGGETHYMYSEEELKQFLQAQEQQRGEVEIADEEAADEEPGAEAEDGPSVRIVEIHERGEVRKTMEQLIALGFTMEDFVSEDEEAGPAFRLGTNGEALTVRSLSEILPAVREIGRRGLEIQRYKGLGEMNAEELAGTTMNPASRTLLKITVNDAAEADHIFTILAGKDVSKRRSYIEEHALEVRNLDV